MLNFFSALLLGSLSLIFSIIAIFLVALALFFPFKLAYLYSNYSKEEISERIKIEFGAFAIIIFCLFYFYFNLSFLWSAVAPIIVLVLLTILGAIIFNVFKTIKAL